MKKTLLILIPSIFVLLAIGTGVYFSFFTPEAQAKRLAEKVIVAATAQQEDTFKSYDLPQNSESFYRAVAQRNYRLDSFVLDQNTYYARYIFTDDTAPRYARIGVENNRITSLASGDGIATIPSDDKQVVVEKDKNEFCLTRDDLTYLDSTSLYAHIFRGATMIFTGDTSTEYAGAENGKRLLDRMYNFYDKSSSKDYYFMIRGYLAATPDTLEARKQVIQNRTTKIQQELVARGIPEDRVTIGDTVAYPIDRPTDGHDERYVIIDIVNNCNEA